MGRFWSQLSVSIIKFTRAPPLPQRRYHCMTSIAHILSLISSHQDVSEVCPKCILFCPTEQIYWYSVLFILPSSDINSISLPPLFSLRSQTYIFKTETSMQTFANFLLLFVLSLFQIIVCIDSFARVTNSAYSLHYIFCHNAHRSHKWASAFHNSCYGLPSSIGFLVGNW